MWVLHKEKANTYDFIHIHIAYPLLVHYHLWKKWVKCKFLVSEHWSAYHFNFYLPKNSPKLNEIKNIFRQGLPVIAVSEALLEDIREFSGTSDFESFVLPNVIDLKSYYYVEKQRKNEVPVFFIVNIWREIKKPLVLLEAFNQLAISGMQFDLHIGGFGPMIKEMKAFVRDKGLSDQAIFLGEMDNQEIANQLHDADAYLFSSEYETFSISCAQALCCGVPLIGPEIPAIREYAGADEMITVDSNDVSGWGNAIKQFVETVAKFDREAIALKYQQRFSDENLLEGYQAILGVCRQENATNV